MLEQQSTKPSLPLEFQDRYEFITSHGYWAPKGGISSFSYSDGDEIERRIYDIVCSVDDLCSASAELASHISDWPTQYHLSPLRANLFHPFSQYLKGNILEIGAGCGAISRILGESGSNVVAIEGSQMRAAIASARCRDLKNISIIVDAFHQVPPTPTYDIVTLIGVLEYARKYFPCEEGDPINAMIQHAKAFLKPQGILIIAIENQLGLKYFAGFNEDHVGIPLFGIEDRYDEKSVVTFGQVELQQRLVNAGLTASHFWYPFPDYKLPNMLVSEQALSGKLGEKLASTIGVLFNRDPQYPISPLFSLEQAWQPILRNKLGGALANSFLVFAANEEHHITFGKESKAYYLSTFRKPEYTKMLTFDINNAEQITVKNQLLFPERSPAENVPIEMVYKQEESFIDGELWIQRLRAILQQEYWTTADLVAWTKQWLLALINLSKLNIASAHLSANQIVSGTLLDATPWNLIITPEGKEVFIDQEWSAHIPLEFGFLFFRSVFFSFISIGKASPPANGTSLNILDLFKEISNALDLTITQQDIGHYLKLENEIQTWLVGSKVKHGDAILTTNLILTPSISHPIATNSPYLYHFPALLVEKDILIADLKATIYLQEKHITEIYSSTSWRITHFLRILNTYLQKIRSVLFQKPPLHHSKNERK